MHKPSIKHWNDDEKPREKFRDLGRSALSLPELIAILLATGVRRKGADGKHISISAVDLGREIMTLGNGDIEQVSKLSIEELQQVDGIGPAKAITIAAALELGYRRHIAETRADVKHIKSSKDAYDHLRVFLQDLHVEQFWVLFLARNHKVIKAQMMSQGGIGATVLDPGPLLKNAVLNNASAMVLCHNHPSGNLKPSTQDINLTEKIVAAAKYLDICVTDHIIITDTSYYSFSDNGLLPSA